MGEEQLLMALRGGDEASFRELVTRYHGSLVRVASAYVPSAAVAEEVAQETWLAVIQGIDRFEARSSFKTWLFRILVNRARTRGVREHRTVPFASLSAELEGDEASVEADRFHPDGHRVAGHWSSPPAAWSGLPEEQLLAGETLGVVRETVQQLPPAQRTVLELRDIEGWSSSEVAEIMEISEGNQRVLLHRARVKVRAALERHFELGAQS
jgi:RNA polymerase sigma-70 factor (ECF subfamily)